MSFHEFREHPGLIYVVATLVPLASFVLLLLVGSLRAALRANRCGGVCDSLLRALGGDSPRRAGAYVARAAIGISCVLCLIGFIQYTSQHPELEEKKIALEKDIRKLHAQEHEAKDEQEEKKIEEKITGLEEKIDEIEGHWSGRITWARLSVPGLSDPDRGTILQLGYRIDTLAATMFMMVTFIATLIHVFSLG